MSKYAGVAAVLLAWTVLVPAVYIVGFDNLTALSDLGVYEETKFMFNSSLLVGAFLILAFYVHLGREYNLGKYHKLLYTAAFVSQLILIPLPADSVVRGSVYIAHWMFAVVLYLVTMAIMFNLSDTLGKKLPVSIRSSAVFFVLVLASALGLLTYAEVGGVLWIQIAVTLYTHYWIIRASFLGAKA